jgi:Trypsin-like peptidase domain/Domain of unknown function (DUF4190)/Prokaryotic RING finger family 1
VSQPGSVSLTAGAREAGTVCPHCTTPIRSGDPVNVCQACGTAHHDLCWRVTSRCGSYDCSPARRDLSRAETPLRISAEELDNARPQPPPVVNGTYPQVRPFVPPGSGPSPGRQGTSRLAIAALVCALCGIPLFGLLTGLVAILLGSLALGSLRHSQKKGAGLAVTGILVGLLDVVGWLVVLLWVFATPPRSQILDFQTDLDALRDFPPHINRAMRANVVIESHRGWGRLGGMALGSGVILKIDKDRALVLTNRHVVDAKFTGEPRDEIPTDEISVLMVGGLPEQGTVVWVAPDGIDAAIVRVQVRGDGLAARWDPARRVQVSDTVFAIGNPNGLEWSYTNGTVSQFRVQKANHRRVRIIQTNTTINQGNSGGGLYDNKDGCLIGINTWTQDKRATEGLNFAITLESLADLFPPNLGLRPNVGKE